MARLEKGDDGVAIGTLAMATLVLGEIDRVANFFDAATDDTGLMFDRKNLPKRIDGKRKPKLSSGGQDKAHRVAATDDEDGIGF